MAAIKKETESFYSHESQKVMQENNVQAYIHYACRRLQDENERLNRVFSGSDLIHSIVGVCEIQLIDAHQAKLQAEFDLLLREDRREELRMVYLLLQRVPGGTGSLRESWEKLIFEDGSERLLGSAVECKVNLCFQDLLGL